MSQGKVFWKTKIDGVPYGERSDGSPDMRFRSSKRLTDSKAHRHPKMGKDIKKVRKSRRFDYSAFQLGFLVGWVMMGIMAIWGLVNYNKRQEVILRPVVESNVPVVEAAQIPPVCSKPYGNLICAHDGWDWNKMYALALCESDDPLTPGPRSINPNAQHTNRDGSVDTGIFQINSIHGVGAEVLKNPELNVATARKIWGYQGYGAWAALYTPCYYAELDKLSI